MLILDSLHALDDALVIDTADRISNMPLPVTCTIAISQITWIFLVALPFQLLHLLRWITIPISVLSVYSIFGFATIGNEIKNPLGLKVNDLLRHLLCTDRIRDSNHL